MYYFLQTPLSFSHSALPRFAYHDFVPRVLFLHAKSLEFGRYSSEFLLWRSGFSLGIFPNLLTEGLLLVQILYALLGRSSHARSRVRRPSDLNAGPGQARLAKATKSETRSERI